MPAFWCVFNNATPQHRHSSPQHRAANHSSPQHRAANCSSSDTCTTSFVCNRNTGIEVLQPIAELFCLFLEKRLVVVPQRDTDWIDLLSQQPERR